MLENLKIKNIAIIEDLSVDFGKGLNVLIGETGAGKSILIDSLSFLLGNRADKSLVRSSQTFARVDGIFSFDKTDEKMLKAFEKIGLETDEQILITRTISLENKSETRINGQIVTAGMLREITPLLVDIYAQNESQFLLKSKNQLHLLDNYIRLNKQECFIFYKANLIKLNLLDEKLAQFGGTEEERFKEIDYLNFQINEIELAKLSQDEERDLQDKKKKFSNLEKILQSTTDAENSLNGGVKENIGYAVNQLNNAMKFDDGITDLSNRLSTVKIELNDIIETLSDYNQSSDFSAEEFNLIDERLDLYKALERKYSTDVEGILNKLVEMKNVKQNLINSSEIVKNLLKEKQMLLNETFMLSQQISKLRKAGADILCSKILQELKDLGMPNANLKFEFLETIFKQENLLSDGMDTIDLKFSANLGEPVKSLKEIISGGEMSRLMLALKTVVASVDDMPTMIFDEIDTGISGKMAQAVARKMAVISNEHQVLAITHSSQIASMGDNVYLIFKLIENGKTTSKIKLLNREEKLAEVAKFLSGDHTSSSAIQNASDLINEQEMFKQNLK